MLNCPKSSLKSGPPDEGNRRASLPGGYLTTIIPMESARVNARKLRCKKFTSSPPPPNFSSRRSRAAPPPKCKKTHRHPSNPNRKPSRAIPHSTPGSVTVLYATIPRMKGRSQGKPQPASPTDGRCTTISSPPRSNAASPCSAPRSNPPLRPLHPHRIIRPRGKQRADPAWLPHRPLRQSRHRPRAPA